MKCNKILHRQSPSFRDPLIFVSYTLVSEWTTYINSRGLSTLYVSKPRKYLFGKFHMKTAILKAETNKFNNNNKKKTIEIHLRIYFVSSQKNQS